MTRVSRCTRHAGHVCLRRLADSCARAPALPVAENLAQKKEELRAIISADEALQQSAHHLRLRQTCPDPVAASVASAHRRVCRLAAR